MAGLPDLANLDYVHRVDRAIDHVTRHLAEPLQLEDVARVACFSPYHFHRIFRAPVELELRALDWLYTMWLPHSGHVPDHQPCFEAWNGEPFGHGRDHFELRIQLAVSDAGALHVGRGSAL